RAMERQYRKLLSSLNADLGVVEVKMAARRWADIEPTAVPSRANRVYAAALQNRLPRRVHKRDAEADRVAGRAGLVLTKGESVRS
ncbi:DUF2828 domain-containing protein, partial [Escherichia coli]|nr:DUF2828 domain-containing protein [Escherichia coli]